MLSGMIVCSLIVSLAGVSYASPGQVGVELSYSVNQEKRFTIHKEDYTTYVTYYEIPRTLDIRVVDKHTGETVLEKHDASILAWLEHLTEGIEYAVKKIPKTLKKMVMFIQLIWINLVRVKSKKMIRYKDPRTGWFIEKNKNDKGDTWKLRNKSGLHIASLTEEGKIVGE
ncbi:predicted unsaturated glucuronyl hydrolase [Paenibacillus popilliae ATCC 14706]|uniref:Predicted unsaturated glucuronyl hydrolase n=2 Tax=Paenibacillus popilliae TaxID=78057 RepID=M9LBV5_PAEPP|nr:predicted unsaturated glucuronyl hydrolase [Paenibacillus popilliae ATCC 14706]